MQGDAQARKLLEAPPAATLAVDVTPREALLALVASPNIASRRSLFEQYDAIVQSRTVRRPEQADAAVLKLDCALTPAGEDRSIPALAVTWLIGAACAA